MPTFIQCLLGAIFALTLVSNITFITLLLNSWGTSEKVNSLLIKLHKIREEQDSLKHRYQDEYILFPNEKSYLFHLESETDWYAAEKLCRRKGMHMARITSKYELELLWKKTKEWKKDVWWVSASDVGRSPGNFFWHDGTILKNESDLWWKDGKPNEPNSFGDGMKTCVNLYDWKLWDYTCNDTNYVICEFQPLEISSTIFEGSGWDTIDYDL